MAEGNGSPATRAELGAHVKGIDEHFDTIERDITEMKDNFKAELSEIKGLIEGIYQTFRAERRDRTTRWRTWGPPIAAAIIAGAVSLPLYIIH